MAYKALYRTYRPTTFEEVAGQQHIVKTIKNALATGKIAHAYLFAGPRGTGKTTMAKLLAKALNCEEGIGCQCNHCDNCIAINKGTHPDVIEIDAASNNGVDQVRDIVDRVKYGTILGKYKVYIIDEVHMMSPGAFNALLKTLEEPPSHVIFILATTEPHKILPTILSRCQRYDFSKVSDADIRERLQIVLEKENIVYNASAVDLIISLADGGMRDALSMLDQVLAYSGDVLKEEDVLEIFSLESIEEKIELIKSIFDGDIADVLKRVNNYIDKGTDIKRLTSDLLDIFKDLLIFMNTRKESFLGKLPTTEAMALSKRVRDSQVMELIDILLDTQRDYKVVQNINPVFEVAMLKLVMVFGIKQVQERPVDIEPVIKPAPVREQTVEPLVEEVKPSVVEQPSLFDAPVEVNNHVQGLIIPKHLTGEEMYEVPDDLMINIMVSAKKEIKNVVSGKWDNLKRYIVHPQLGKAASILFDSHPLVASNNILIIECPLKSTVETANMKETQEALQNITNIAFENQMFVYAVTRSDSVRLQKKYMDLLSIGKLPKAKDIVIELEGE